MNETTTLTSLMTTFEESTTTTTVSLSEQEMFTQLNEQLTRVNDCFTFIIGFLCAFVVFLVCRYCYRFLNMFF